MIYSDSDLRQGLIEKQMAEKEAYLMSKLPKTWYTDQIPLNGQLYGEQIGSGLAGVQPPPKPEIIESVTQLESNVKDLDRLLDNLYEKLSPILKTLNPAPVYNSPDPGPLCPLAEAINQQNKSLKYSYYRIIELLDRLAL